MDARLVSESSDCLGLVIVPVFTKVRSSREKYDRFLVLGCSDDRADAGVGDQYACAGRMCIVIAWAQAHNTAEAALRCICVSAIDRLGEDIHIQCVDQAVEGFEKSRERELGTYGGEDHITRPKYAAPVAAATSGHCVTHRSETRRAMRPDNESSAEFAMLSIQTVRLLNRNFAIASPMRPGSAPVLTTTSGRNWRITRTVATILWIILTTSFLLHSGTYAKLVTPDLSGSPGNVVMYMTSAPSKAARSSIICSQCPPPDAIARILIWCRLSIRAEKISAVDYF